MSTYRIVRMYQNHPKEKLRLRGLTLAEAQAHCRNPQTSSSTCTTAEGKRRTALKGPWFEGYEEEKPKSRRAHASEFAPVGTRTKEVLGAQTRVQARRAARRAAKKMDPLGF